MSVCNGADSVKSHRSASQTLPKPAREPHRSPRPKPSAKSPTILFIFAHTPVHLRVGRQLRDGCHRAAAARSLRCASPNNNRPNDNPNPLQTLFENRSSHHFVHFRPECGFKRAVPLIRNGDKNAPESRLRLCIPSTPVPGITAAF